MKFYLSTVPNEYFYTLFFFSFQFNAKTGSGNFAAVLKIKEKATNKDFALKIIDKSMCKGKEHYIDAEVRVMKKLNHPHIMSLYKDIDTLQNMYLILEYVSGKIVFSYKIIVNQMFINFL